MTLPTGPVTLPSGTEDRIELALRALVGAPLAIDPDALEAAVARAALGGVEAAAAPSSRRQGRVAIIRLSGILAPRPSFLARLFGAVSTIEFGELVRQAVDDPDVVGVVLSIDSPGGTADGTEEAARALFRLRGRKPIVAVADYLMASAAYWIGSAADAVIASPTAQVGSIGVVTVHREVSRFAESMGVRYTVIRAGRLKAAGNPFEPLSEEGRDTIQRLVDDLYADFVQAVARHRATTPEAVATGYGEGALLSARAALEAGMVDRIATVDEVVADLVAGRPVGGRRWAWSRTFASFTPAVQEEARRVAYHEAGHAVASYLTGAGVDRVWFDLAEDRRAIEKGWTRARDPGRADSGVWLAGAAAEQIAGFAGHASDADRAGALARLGDARAILRAQGYDDADIDPYPEKLARGAALHYVQQQAEARLRDAWPAVEAVAAALLEQGELSGDEAERLIAAALGADDDTAEEGDTPGDDTSDDEDRQ